jgi:hypothetical protein
VCSACKTCYNHAKGHAPSTTLAWRNLDQTRCRGGKEVTGLAYYYLWQYVKRGKGESGKCISYWGTRGKRWGSGKRVGGWLMKGKEIGRLLGDHKGEGGVYVCIKTK